MISRLAYPLLVGALVLTGACLSVPDAPAHECDSTSDCRAASGEVCEQGTCWGDPPSEPLTFVVVPPAEHTELVPLEISDLPIGDDGRMQLIQLMPPVSLTGQLEATCVPPMPCDSTKLQATITIARESLFPGGPGFKAVTNTGTSNNGAMLSLRVPPFVPGKDFTITIVPQPRTENDVNSLAQFVPPLHQTIRSIADAQKALTLGAMSMEHIEGTLLASSGSGLANYRVVALGKWDEDGAPTEVSTVAFTGSDGSFRLFLSPDLESLTELMATPVDPMSVAPTLHLALTQSQTFLTGQTTISQPANLGAPRAETFHITGRDGSGDDKDIVGARVRVSATVPTPDGGTAVFAEEGSTDDSGSVSLLLLDGAIALNYTLDIVPPASSTVGAIYAQPYTLGGQNEFQLPTRVRLRGHVLDVHGEKLAGVSVTARPSYRFAWNLDDDAQTFLNSIAVSTAVTNDSGEYVVWVDPMIDNVTATYDLAIEPARTNGTHVRAPNYVENDVAIGPSMANASITVGDIHLPDAAFIHGDVVDSVGSPVENTEIKVFRASTDYASVCSSSQHAPTPCPIQARLLGRGSANSSGTVELTLPRE